MVLVMASFSFNDVPLALVPDRPAAVALASRLSQSECREAGVGYGAADAEWLHCVVFVEFDAAGLPRPPEVYCAGSALPWIRGVR